MERGKRTFEAVFDIGWALYFIEKKDQRRETMRYKTEGEIMKVQGRNNGRERKLTHSDEGINERKEGRRRAGEKERNNNGGKEGWKEGRKEGRIL